MARKGEFTDADAALLQELGIETVEAPAAVFTREEERIIAGFEEIMAFVERVGRPPQRGDGSDIFERLYATRLDSLRRQQGACALLQPFDRLHLLSGPAPETSDAEDDASLLASLGITPTDEDITTLRHVRPAAEIHAAEEIATREKCRDFARFRPGFEAIQRDLDDGVRLTRPFGKDASVLAGDFFILGGQLVCVAEVGEEVRAPNGEPDARIRAIFSNGTESNLLRRSLQRALYKDEGGRRITAPDAGPLFADGAAEGEAQSGTLYVLRSLSDLPQIAANRELVHKIGVTGGDVRKRIADAAHEATYLLADVEIVSTYELYGINRTRLEALVHRIFAPARLDIEIMDRFGNPVRPREWFLVPIAAIDRAVDLIRAGTIVEYVYDPQQAKLVRGEGASGSV